MNTGRETFHKSERLCSRKFIGELFDKGITFYTPLFKVVWLISPELLPFPAQVAFSVSKRSFKNAVERNLIRRRMRESYRKLKYILYDFLEKRNKQLIFIVVYRRNEASDYNASVNGMKVVIDKLMVHLRNPVKS